jgi:rhodanese-related sulfurtransferase/glyoxylase-like metal-dependent hydrolase (beta-lactamase superfamily II)
MNIDHRTSRRSARGAFLPAVAVATLAAFTPAQDAERLTHGDEAASPQVSFEEKGPDFVLRQYQLGCLAQLTYLIGSQGEAAVVDPQRDVEHYLRDAQALGLTIKKVFLTHTNADFVAGHTELAQRIGAEVFISADSHSDFRHTPLHDGDRISIGALSLEAWATPGHTLDAMTFLIRVPAVAAQPTYALTGDTLFIGGIGRPDLVGGAVTPVILAEKAWDSMERLKTLPDAVRVLPAHGAGSLCGAHLSPETVSSIGAEKATNPYLRANSKAQFVSRVVSGLPIAPQYFRHNVALNRAGPPVVDWTSELPPGRTPAQVAAAVASGAWVIDLRDAVAYAAGHVAGAVNVAVRGRLDTWTGTVVPFDADLLLVGSDAEVREATFRLRRIGYDRVSGHLAGGMDAWLAAGQAVRTSDIVLPADLAARMAKGAEPMIVDVRTPAESAEMRIGDYANIPITEFEEFGRVLDPKQPIVLVCNSAFRSSMAIGLAERQGFEHVASLAGGLDGWLTAGLPVYGSGSLCAGSVCPTDLVTEPAAKPVAVTDASANSPLVLPEPMDAAALARGLADQPQLHAVFDVRPAWQFAEYHVPAAVNVEPAAVLELVSTLPPGVRAVIVDRDGTEAFSIAALAQARDAGRSVRALLGGTLGWWRASLGGNDAGAMPSAPSTAPVATSPMPPIPAPQTPKLAPKKRSAGC